MSLTQIQLAAALGLSQAAISQSVAKGMPTHSIEAARAWRETHLHPGRAKPAPRPPTLAALLRSAEAAIEAGEGVAPLLPDLRLALRQVPADQRAAVAMSEALWDVLTDPVGSAFERETPESLTTAEAESMGAFWFSAAAGEVIAP